MSSQSFVSWQSSGISRQSAILCTGNSIKTYIVLLENETYPYFFQRATVSSFQKSKCDPGPVWDNTVSPLLCKSHSVS